MREPCSGSEAREHVAVLTLRPATPADVGWFERWAADPGVIEATSDDPGATGAFGDTDWADEVAAEDQYSQYFIAELDDRPIGAMQICDPHLESSHYWGEMPANLRAID